MWYLTNQNFKCDGKYIRPNGESGQQEKRQKTLYHTTVQIEASYTEQE